MRACMSLGASATAPGPLPVRACYKDLYMCGTAAVEVRLGIRGHCKRRASLTVDACNTYEDLVHALGCAAGSTPLVDRASTSRARATSKEN